MRATQYDPSIIQSMADALYTQAKGLELSRAVLGFLLGTAAGVVPLVPLVLTEGAGGIVGVGLLVCLGLGIVGAVIGRSMARVRAAQLRGQAQTMLCQLQIEKNTRRPYSP